MRTEEIRALIEELKPNTDYWKGYIDGLKRALEDHRPKVSVREIIAKEHPWMC